MGKQLNESYACYRSVGGWGEREFSPLYPCKKLEVVVYTCNLSSVRWSWKDPWGLLASQSSQLGSSESSERLTQRIIWETADVNLWLAPAHTHVHIHVYNTHTAEEGGVEGWKCSLVAESLLTISDTLGSIPKAEKGRKKGRGKEGREKRREGEKLSLKRDSAAASP